MYQHSLPLSGSFPSAQPLSCLFSSPRSEAEKFRLRIIERLRLVESPLWLSLETQVEFLSDLLDVPVCYVSVVDEQYQYFLASRGLDTESVPRSKTPDNRLLYDREKNRVQDTSRTASESYRYLLEELGWRAHASVPVHSAEGFALGSVGVADRNPRIFQPLDLQCLRKVSEEVAGEIEDKQRSYSDPFHEQRRLKL